MTTLEEQLRDDAMDNLEQDERRDEQEQRTVLGTNLEPASLELKASIGEIVANKDAELVQKGIELDEAEGGFPSIAADDESPLNGSTVLELPFLTPEQFEVEMAAVLEEARAAAASLTPEQRLLIVGALGQVSAILAEGLETPARDTESPSPLPTYGWLEQYAVFASEQLADLETLVLAGLTEEENEQLIKVAHKLVTLSELKDPDAFMALAEMMDYEVDRKAR